MREEQALYVASSNRGKLRDFEVALSEFARLDGAAFSILPLPGLGAIAAPEETADSFAGNAEAKAIYYSLHAPGRLVIADDSGLEVDALDGAPGVYSARYAEQAGVFKDEREMTRDAQNNAHLLAELARALEPADLLASLDHRGACYRCVLAAARDGACLVTAEGAVEGQILLSPRGQGGFGYDPYFYLPALEQTMAELSAAMRLRLSHRGAALRALLSKLAGWADE